MKRILFVVVLLFCFELQAKTWSGYTEITRLYPTKEGLVFNTAYKNTGLSSCDGGSRFVLDISATDYSTQASVLLAAFMAGKRVDLYIEDLPVRCDAVVNRFRVAR
uniref:hypothetical protein n=1 Tax=Rheinheimera sp. TaxID=1869214 RepID=UPI00404745A6